MSAAPSSPYQLIRVQRDAPQFEGQWRALYFCPDPASPQEFVVGVACLQGDTLVAWRLLEEFDKFECMYGKRLPVSALKPYFARVTDVLKEREKKGELPAIGKLSEQLRWGEPLHAAGDTADAAADDLYQTVVALLPEVEVRGRPVFKARSTLDVRRRVNERLKVLWGLRYESLVNERGYEEVKDSSGVHRLEINLRSGKKVGTVVSAWYGTLQSVSAQVLQAEADLTAAQKLYGASRAGLFVVRPFEPRGVPSAEMEAIDTFLEKSKWRCGMRGNLFNQDEDENRLAEAIAEFF